jgi:hypothetical protein
MYHMPCTPQMGAEVDIIMMFNLILKTISFDRIFDARQGLLTMALP